MSLPLVLSNSFWDSISQWTWSLPVWFEWLADETLGSPASACPALGLQEHNLIPGFHMGAGDWAPALMIMWQAFYQLSVLSSAWLDSSTKSIKEDLGYWVLGENISNALPRNITHQAPNMAAHVICCTNAINRKLRQYRETFKGTHSLMFLSRTASRNYTASWKP